MNASAQRLQCECIRQNMFGIHLSSSITVLLSAFDGHREAM